MAEPDQSSAPCPPGLPLPLAKVPPTHRDPQGDRCAWASAGQASDVAELLALTRVFSHKNNKIRTKQMHTQPQGTGCEPLREPLSSGKAP